MKRQRPLPSCLFRWSVRQEQRAQVALLSFRLGGGGWVLTPACQCLPSPGPQSIVPTSVGRTALDSDTVNGEGAAVAKTKLMDEFPYRPGSAPGTVIPLGGRGLCTPTQDAHIRLQASQFWPWIPRVGLRETDASPTSKLHSFSPCLGRSKVGLRLGKGEV